MSFINSARVIGNVGQDPKIDALQNGDKKASFSVATTEKWTDKRTGEKKDFTEWHRIVVFNQAMVSVVERYVKKGSKVGVEGEMKTREWTDQQGVKQRITEIVLSAYKGELQLLSLQSGRDDEDSSPPTVRAAAQQDYKAASGGSTYAIDDEIPF
jgi:single-strand DNA-binding protein